LQIEVTVLLRRRVASEDVPVVEKLKRFGMSVERVLPHLSIISGRIDRSNLAALQALPEVKEVQEAGIFHVDPIER
jgi:hypothetical protein